MQGQQLGKYVLDELVAVGGMAEIYRARTASALGGVEKQLAVKRLHPQYCTDRDFVEMLVEEARIAMQLNHKNIGQVFDLERDGESFFLAMEYVHGRDLFRVIRRFIERGQLMPLECACYIATEICSGLSYAHRRLDADGEPLNIIHRDISPQNVLVSFEGEIKIVDFGIAKAARRASFTQSGVIKGKFYYMAPEQARGDRIDQRADIFSVGAILYEMATGRMLYEGEDDARLVYRARRADYQPPSFYSPDIPGQLEQIILKALARDLHQRFATARDMQLALTNLAHSMGWAYDSVMLSDQMHLLFEGARGVGANTHGAPPPDYPGAAAPQHGGGWNDAGDGGGGWSATGDPGWNGAGGHDPAHGYYPHQDPHQAAAYAPQPAGYAAAEGYAPAEGYAQAMAMAPAPAPVDEDAATHVYGDEIGRIVEQIDAHYDGQRAAAAAAPAPLDAGGALRRAPVPAAHREVDLQVDHSARRQETAIGPMPLRPPAARRSGPPPLLIATAVVGLVLLVGAFVFAATQLFSSPEEKTGGPRIENAAVADTSAVFSVLSEPSGARIFIDGTDTGLLTPASLTNVRTGARNITLRLRHHDELSQQVTVESGGQWSAALTPRRGVLRIDTTPPGATIHVDGVAVGTAPLDLEGQLMSESHTVAASLEGYKNVVRTVHWVTEDTILDVSLTLQRGELQYASALQGFIQGAQHNVVGALATSPAPGGEAPSAAATAQTDEVPSTDTPPRSTTPRRDDVRKPKDSSSSDTAGRGKISVASKPPGDVFVDGKDIGRKTPLNAFSVGSGYHKVKVRYADGSFSAEKRALVKPGAEIKLFFRQ